MLVRFILTVHDTALGNVDLYVCRALKLLLFLSASAPLSPVSPCNPPLLIIGEDEEDKGMEMENDFEGEMFDVPKGDENNQDDNVSLRQRIESILCFV